MTSEGPRPRRRNLMGPPPAAVAEAMALLVAEGRETASTREVQRALRALDVKGAWKSVQCISRAVRAAGWTRVAGGRRPWVTRRG